MDNYHLGTVPMAFPSRKDGTVCAQRYRKWEKGHANTKENKAPCSFLSHCSDEVQQQNNPTSTKKNPQPKITPVKSKYKVYAMKDRTGPYKF